MKKFNYQGKKKDELLAQALEEQNLTESDIFYTITEEKVGLLKSKRYVLEFVKISDVADYGKSLLVTMLKSLNINAHIETNIRNGFIKYEIHSDNNSLLIGKNGSNLSALQTLIRQMIFNKLNLFPNIVLDVENYKQKQNYFLIKKAKKLAREVTLTKTDIKLDPMNSFDRRNIHEALQNFKYVITESEGEEPNRYVVIKYTEEKKDKK